MESNAIVRYLAARYGQGTRWPHDPAAIEAARLRTEARIAILDAHFDGRAFLEEERLTIADIAVGAGVHRWPNLPLDRAPRPHVERWYESLRARPAAQAASPLPMA